MQGSHSAGIAETKWKNIAKFIVHGEVFPATIEDGFVEKQRWFLKLVSSTRATLWLGAAIVFLAIRALIIWLRTSTWQCASNLASLRPDREICRHARLTRPSPIPCTFLAARGISPRGRSRGTTTRKHGTTRNTQHWQAGKRRRQPEPRAVETRPVLAHAGRGADRARAACASAARWCAMPRCAST